MDAAGDLDILHVPILVDDKIHEHASLDAVFDGILGILQILVDPLLQEEGRVAGSQEHRLDVAVAPGNGVGHRGRILGAVLPEQRTGPVAQAHRIIVDVLQFLLHPVEIDDVVGVAAGIVLRIAPRCEKDGRDLLVVEGPVVGGVGFVHGDLRLDRQQFALQGADDAVQVLVGGGVGIEAVLRRAQHVQVDHRVDVRHVGEGPVQEIPGAGEGLLRGAEGDEEDVPPQEDAVRREPGGQFQQHREAGGVAVGPVEDAADGLPVLGERVHPEIVQPGADDDVPVVHGLVPARDEGHDVAGGQGVGPFAGDAELLPRDRRDQVDAVLLQGAAHVFGRFLFPFGTGLAAFQGGGRKIGDVLLEGMDRLGVVQVVIGRRAGPELGRQRRGKQQAGRCEKETLHHFVIRLQESTRPAGKFRSRAVRGVSSASRSGCSRGRRRRPGGRSGN